MLAPTRAAVAAYRHTRIPSRLPVVDGTGVAVPPERAARLRELTADLRRHGFVHRLDVAPADPEASPTTYAWVHVHQQERIHAWAIDMVGLASRATFVELTTEFEDATVVTTVNYETPSIFEQLPRVRRTLLPGAPVDEVVAAHRAACAEVPGARRNRLHEDPLALAQQQNVEILAHQAACGILRERGTDYGFTFRGARRSTARLLAARSVAA